MSMTEVQALKLGAFVSRSRHKQHITIRELAEAVGCNASWIGHLERGRYLDPSPDRLARIAEALDIEPSRIDRITKGSVAEALPGMRTYFRAKYDLTPGQIERVEAYVRRLQRKDAA
ncbi:helix-turn-helix domain-containing protein [Conexibacter sp. CPCC 206217]|uniref:helix-turn-helix domain-containing protein n=1 Tax=Conexibacter sp. CPCC 206217 TaxID=3064574 RepID=UPI002716F0C4|nr:helix-turn-helix transcriptional regulator [Conexibacter sp. CPCC 206217]MDO8213480.1 helix-turn-helix transcriptional regulator [Conexibacter sp. CPCC 206217]